VTIESVMDKHEVVFVVWDSGPGIPPRCRQRFGSRSLPPDREALVSARDRTQRIEEAGGTVRLVPSQNGEGARFELRLPVQNRER